MGSPVSENHREKDKIRHRVTISSFHMGVHEVTQKEYRELSGKGDERSVVWNSEANGYRLPMEIVINNPDPNVKYPCSVAVGTFLYCFNWIIDHLLGEMKSNSIF